MTVKPSAQTEVNHPQVIPWDEYRTTLRRLLITWTRDIDVADDLLQDTYLRVQAGWHTYRGGDLHAWLVTIAKNVFYSHLRKQRGAAIIDETVVGDTSSWAGSSVHVETFVVREAIHALPPHLQTALILRHFGEFSYQQIAERCHCPVGTARQRVWTAIRRLRQQLGAARKEPRSMHHKVNGIQLLEYLYGALSADQLEAVKAQLKESEEARRELQQLQEVMSSLNQVAGDFLLFYLVELDEDGAATYYTWGRMRNMTERPLTEFTMINATGSISDFAAFQGEVVALEAKPWEQDPTRLVYVAHLPTPVMPGDCFDGMVIMHMSEDRPALPRKAIKVADGRWRFSQQLGLGAQRDATIIIQGVRLPCGGELLATHPPVDSVKQDRATTVFWRFMPVPDQPIEIRIEYRR